MPIEFTSGANVPMRPVFRDQIEKSLGGSWLATASTQPRRGDNPIDVTEYATDFCQLQDKTQRYRQADAFPGIVWRGAQVEAAKRICDLEADAYPNSAEAFHTAVQHGGAELARELELPESTKMVPTGLKELRGGVLMMNLGPHLGNAGVLFLDPRGEDGMTVVAAHRE